MKNMNWVKRAALFGVALYCAFSVSAQSVCDSVAIHFHVNEAELDWNFMTNRSSLEEIKEKFNREYNDTASWKLLKVEVVGSFPPEGTLTKNRALAERRADTLRAEEAELEELDEFTEREFHWALKTNLLYDALAIPNVGVELQLDNDWSVAANWTYAWWKKGVERRWRVYGADMAVRRWFGRKAKEKALTGHHVGIYAQALTYDFCLDEKGYMGGKPGGNLWDKLNYAVGLEYGYSMPIARRLNIDFVLGIGYWGGTYHEYKVVDHCKVWQTTKERQWFGPTKAEVSLVWFLGTSGLNKKKGGAR